MYRNYGNLMDETVTNSGTLGSCSSAQQSQRKFFGGRDTQFVPNLDTVTSRQDLHWLVQPLLAPTAGTAGPPHPPFPPPRGPHPLPSNPSQAHLVRPGVIRAVGGAQVVTTARRRNDEFLSPEDLEKRKLRRERNKIAAARCRNRRRELTESLQKETEELEADKARLQKEIANLQKEKERLQLVLEAHRPICKILDSDSDSETCSALFPVRVADSDLPGPLSRTEKPKPKITLPPATLAPTVSTAPSGPPDSESLHTPIFICTPSLTPFTTSLVFTYPSAPLDAGDAAGPSHHQGSPASSPLGMAQQPQCPQPCGVAHRRSSSSGDQSDRSLSSPTVLML
ncbi:fos-related antigen 1a [Megalops cyprinoides]|uniref:fos-related antigen 1a n=1 Tax=Megalops cyprinoides TaxID=118141 RepID=UPI001864F0CB|nr:fos-related antigen 1a [Megalops cyprinoides]